MFKRFDLTLGGSFVCRALIWGSLLGIVHVPASVISCFAARSMIWYETVGKLSFSVCDVEI